MTDRRDDDAGRRFEKAVLSIATTKPLDLDTVARLSVAGVSKNANTYAVYTDREGRALRGHDPVAYFTLGTPTMGNPGISREWNGATWLFASETNRDLFDGNPTAYAPAFGGHCAVAQTAGVNLPGSPKRWRIEDGRLYVNKNLLAAASFGLVGNRIRKLADQADATTDHLPPTENPGVAE